MLRRCHRSLLSLPLFLLPLPPVITAEPKSSPGDRLFGSDKVVQLQLTIGEKAFAALNPAGGAKFGPPGFGPPRKATEGTHSNTFGVELPWSKADLTFAGETLKDVGVRYKGNFTQMASAQSLKKSMKIDLNRHVDGQKIDGLTMINLNSSVTDPSAAREAFSFAFFRQAGVPASRTSFAELSLTVPGKYDKEYVGVYTLIEQVNKGFLKRHFKDGKGMLLKPEGLQGGIQYLGDDWKAYESRYRPDNSPTDEEKKRLIAFARLVQLGTDDDFARQIGSHLDVEAFLRFIAANTLLANLDSYLGFGHNYYLYLVPGTNQFVFIPWDLDLSLATWPAAGMPEQLVELSLSHPHAGKNKLLDRLLADKNHKDRYMAIIKELAAGCFSKTKMTECLNAIEKALKEPMAREAKAVAARKEGRGAGFGMPFGGNQFGQSMPPHKFIEKRTESVASQLDGQSKGFEPKPFGFGFGPPPGGGPGKK